MNREKLDTVTVVVTVPWEDRLPDVVADVAYQAMGLNTRAPEEEPADAWDGRGSKVWRCNDADGNRPGEGISLLHNGDSTGRIGIVTTLRIATHAVGRLAQILEEGEVVI